MAVNRKKKILPFLVVSVIFHLFLALIIDFIFDFSISYKDTLGGTNNRLKIKSIKRDYKIKGSPDGSQTKGKVELTQEEKSANQLDLSSLAVNPNVDQIQPVKKSTKAKENLDKHVDFNVKATKKSDRVAQKKFLKKINAERYLDPVLNNSIFSTNPELPDGFKEDEFNSRDKVYYSFRKRTLEQFIISFVDTYEDFKRTRPQIQRKLMSDKHLLTGRLTFDEKGNIVSIKIMKSSPDDDIHLFFEELLKGVGKIPNPPEDFLTQNREFSIYYLLRIN